MGRAKEEYMRQLEQRWRGVGEKWVCAKCFEDEAIQEFIRNGASAKRCSYCRRFSRNRIAARIDDVLEFIAAGINSEYEDAANGVHWESAEGGYTLPTMDSWELLEEIGLDVENDDLREDLRHAFFDCPWVPKDPYADRWCDALRYNWEAFSKLVKHRTRFVFFRVATANPSFGESEPSEFLDALRSTVIETGLVRTVSTSQKWFRAHEHSPSETLSGAQRLGAPPPQFASHNRMSPAGISMLYVSSNAATAVAEISSGTATASAFTVATFENVRPLCVLDLSDIESVPSLFDAKHRHKRMGLIFLRHFAQEISKPIGDAEKPYEYVPTQVMTEYFRHLFHQPRTSSVPARNGASPQLDGIAFRSSKRGGGVNYTLFIEPQMCGDFPNQPGVVMLLTDATRRHV